MITMVTRLHLLDEICKNYFIYLRKIFTDSKSTLLWYFTEPVTLLGVQAVPNFIHRTDGVLDLNYCNQSRVFKIQLTVIISRTSTRNV